MPIYYRENEKDVFHIHIPKTGGSSITKIFELNNWLQRSFGSIAKGEQHILRKTWKPIFCNNTIKFTVIRNPIDRIKSEIRGNLSYRKEKNFDINKCVNNVLELKLSGETNANHLCNISDFFNKDDNVVIFRFEDIYHRDKIKEKFKLKGKFPHIVGDTYDTDSDYTLFKETEDMIKKVYKKDYEMFYPDLLKED